ncbi:alpha/beta hydrolase fold domain-containing protein [Alloalcanivorax xenomutans]|uniref:alpha/beta hydrolase fold domain-containing protein n=1 Tax=Alloalcanivorax xenomutans TaxID=1094342 RepID=UPI00293028D2|nr:alpha/beta hydrolase fold domain-containing protein [Alloalcanivorax xenomutans]WOA30165.1 alpha/beta hydrolase fold domain-containing protein [Alloalcanivorax xenomutans]
MHVLIVGAGIAGLTAAIALRHKGIDATIVEQAHKLTEIGAGIQIAANGSVVLRELGLESKVAAKSVLPQSFDMRDIRTGKQLWEVPLGDAGAQRWGAPLYNIHRADLIDILAGQLSPESLHLGRHCTGFEQDDHGVTLQLDDGETLHGDVLIGADGIHSVIREQLFGADEVQFSNILMWRALIPAERLKEVDLPERGNYWFGPGRTLITYWIRPQNLYSILASVPSGEVRRESWSEDGDIEELRASFSDLEPRAQAMMDQIDSAFITGMFYRDPIERWTDGRVSLMGDAAHPMVPFLAQGACQGMEDAWVLATMLERHRDNPAAGLTEYEQRRRPRTTRVQSGARAMVKMVHESDSERIKARNGRWKGMQHIDPMSEATWSFVWEYNVLKEVDRPAGEVLGLSATREAKMMERPESQRAFDLWKSAFTPEDVARGHDGMREGYERFLTTHFPVAENVPVEEAELGGVPAFRVGAAGAGAPVVLHFHGGGYMLGSARGSLEYATRLATAVGGECLTVDYRLAPEAPYPAALDDAVDAYRGLVRAGIAPSRILLSGESSGGGLALALGLALKMAGDPLPAGIVAICPFTDLTLSGASIKDFAGEDPAAHRDTLALMAASYFQEHEPRDPLVSPLFGDLSSLPPLFLSAVEGESLLSDCVRLHDRARAAGVDVTMTTVRDSVHVYTLFPFLPETQSTLKALGEWATRVVAEPARAST